MGNTEFDVTELIAQFESGELDPTDYSASVAEIGYNAASYTWDNSVDLFDHSDKFFQIVIDQKLDVIEHFSEFGAWSEQELNDFTESELVGLLVQMVTGDYRELTESDYEDSGRLYHCESDNTWYYYLGL